MIIGEGKHRYEVNHRWAKVPAGKAFGKTHGIVEDKQGRIFIANTSADAIMIFDAEGNFDSSWGAAYQSGAHGLTISEENGVEYLYLANTSMNEVVKTTLAGEVVWEAGTPPRPDIYDENEKKYVPTWTAVGPKGRLYVADGYGQHWVHVYSLGGEYLDSFGGKGSEPGRLECPHGVSIDARDGRPVVQVANRVNVRIDNFTLDGEFIETVIKGPQLRFPCATKHAGGLLYVPDLFSRLSIFDRENRLITHVGDYLDGAENVTRADYAKETLRIPTLAGWPDIPHEHRREGKFTSPHDLHVDEDGNIYVGEWIPDGRVTKLTRV